MFVSKTLVQLSGNSSISFLLLKILNLLYGWRVFKYMNLLLVWIKFRLLNLYAASWLLIRLWRKTVRPIFNNLTCLGMLGLESKMPWIRWPRALFIKSYLEKNSLAQCARFTGMAYRSTAVNWASFMREVFKEYFNNTLRNVKLQGIVEIDESLFGRRVKYHKGNPNRGLKAS